jgi:hypothetical protein
MRYKRRPLDTIGSQPTQREMVGGCCICSASRYEKPHRWYVVTWNRCDIWYLKGSATECESSTEAELVGTDAVMPRMLWTLYFLEAQG